MRLPRWLTAHVLRAQAFAFKDAMGHIAIVSEDSEMLRLFEPPKAPDFRLRSSFTLRHHTVGKKHTVRLRPIAWGGCAAARGAVQRRVALRVG